MAIISGQGGAADQHERVAELTMMAREQGRDVQIIAADRRSRSALMQDERLSGEHITERPGCSLRARWRNLSRRGVNIRSRMWRCRHSTATAGGRLAERPDLRRRAA